MGRFKVADYKAWFNEEKKEHNARFDYYCKMAYRFHKLKDYESTRVDELYKPPRRHFISTLQMVCNLKSKKNPQPVVTGDVFIDLLLDTEANDTTLETLHREFDKKPAPKAAISEEETKTATDTMLFTASKDAQFAENGGCFIDENNYNYSVKRCRRAGHELQKLQLYKIHREKLTANDFIEESEFSPSEETNIKYEKELKEKEIVFVHKIGVNQKTDEKQFKEDYEKRQKARIESKILHRNGVELANEAIIFDMKDNKPVLEYLDVVGLDGKPQTLTLINVTLNDQKKGNNNRNMDGSIQYGMHGYISMVYIFEYNHKMLQEEHDEFTKERKKGKEDAKIALEQAQ